MIPANIVRVVGIVLAALALTGCGGRTSHKVYAQRMGSSNVNERRAAARELRARPIDSKIVPILLLAVRDTDADVRAYAFYALGRASPHEEGVVSAIIAGMSDSVADVRRAVVSTVSELDPFPSAVLPHMIKMLIDPDERVRKHITMAFMGLEGMGVMSLVRQIDTKDENLRMAIIMTLGDIGPSARGAVPRLKKIAAEDENEEFRAAAAAAVGKIER